MKTSKFVLSMPLIVCLIYARLGLNNLNQWLGLAYLHAEINGQTKMVILNGLQKSGIGLIGIAIFVFVLLWMDSDWSWRGIWVRLSGAAMLIYVLTIE